MDDVFLQIVDTDPNNTDEVGKWTYKLFKLLFYHSYAFRI